MYAIPSEGKDYYHSIDRKWISNHYITQWIIPPSQHTPVYGQTATDKSVQPTMQPYTDQEPPPISIHCLGANPDESVHMLIWPRRVVIPPPPKVNGRRVAPSGVQEIPVPIGTTLTVDFDADKQVPWKRRYWYYPLSTLTFQTVFKFNTDKSKFGHVRIAAGAERAVYTNYDPSDQTDHPGMIRLWAYNSPDIRSRDPEKKDQLWFDDEDPNCTDVKRRMQLESIRGPRAKKALTMLPIAGDVYEKLQGGLRAVAFDESTGRLCLSAYNDQKIYVLDYAKAPTGVDLEERHPLPVDFRHSFHDPLPLEPDLVPPGGWVPMNID
jgi:hypothetical protein